MKKKGGIVSRGPKIGFWAVSQMEPRDAAGIGCAGARAFNAAKIHHVLALDCHAR
jgi:hypothetical protein